MKFLLNLNERRLSPRSLSLYMVAIAFQFEALGWADNMTDFRVRGMVEGFKRRVPQQVDERKPITPSILWGLSRSFDTICQSGSAATLFRVVSFLMFFGAFHLGEVLAVSKLWPGNRALRWEDCQTGGGRVSLLLRKSKTNQQGYGRWIHLQASTDPGLCPVRALREYKQKAPEKGELLFKHVDDSPLSRY